MERKMRWGIVGTGAVLAIASLFVIRAGLQPCAWLDIALKRSGCLCTLEEHEAAVESVDFSPDGSLVASSSRDGVVRLWRVADRTLFRTLEAPSASEQEAHSHDIAFSPNGTILALGLPDGTARLWQVKDGVLVHTLEGHSGKVCSLDFSPDGRFLALGFSSGVVQLWQVADGQLSHELGEHKDQVLSVAFSPTGAVLASASLDGAIKLWQVMDGVLVHEVKKTSVATGVAFSPDGSMLATDRQLWSVDDWISIREMKSTQGGMGNVAFSPDGKMLAAGNAWYEVRWWRVADGALLRAVKGHTDSVNSVAFSPGGDVMASGSLDGTVRLWQVPVGMTEPSTTPVSTSEPLPASTTTIPAKEAESGTTIMGTVMDVSLSAHVIMLTEPAEGFSIIALTDDSELVSTHGDEITLHDIRPGKTIQASGQPGESNALLASKVRLLEATPTSPSD